MSGARPRLLAAAAWLGCTALGAAVSGWAVGWDRVSALGAYFDGHLYIEIARSFPLPYSEDGPSYRGQAPAFPALLWLLRLATAGLVDWGTLAMLATWGTAGTAVLAFASLCRALALPAVAASGVFLLANPIWMLVLASPHPEPLAMTFVVLCLRDHVLERLPRSMLWLGLASLARFPAILVGGALAIDWLLLRRRLEWRTFAWLSLPLLIFGAHNAYLFARFPGFTGIWDAHQKHWIAAPTWPFAEFVRYAQLPESWGPYLLHPTTFASLLVYLACIGLGFRRGERELWVLPLWIAVLVGFHVSLTGKEGVDDFMRLVILAWPAAAVVLVRALRGVGVVRVALPACALLGAFSIWYAVHHVRIATLFQNRLPWMKPVVERLDQDEPRWVDFDAYQRAIRRQLQRGRVDPITRRPK